MNRIAWWVGPLAAILATCVLVPAIVWHSAQSRIPIGFYEWEPNSKSPFVMVQRPDEPGHGSGVHIGDGFVLTAAHVVGDKTKMRLLADDNQAMEAEVLWTNRAYDVALMKVQRPVMKSAPLSCSDAKVGTPVRAYGNPMDITFVFTSGTVSGKAREVGPWREALPIDGAVIPGQSGGGVVDTEGRVVGVTVGMMMMPFGPAAFGLVVPSSTVCRLMGRA